MKKLTYSISVLCIVFMASFIMARQRNKGYKVDANACVQNRYLYEDMLIPTQKDTLAFEEISKRYESVELGWDYDMIPVVRGLVDTSLFNRSHWDKFSYVNRDYRLHIILSPLIIEGEVMGVYNEDTSRPHKNLFVTNIVIKITDIIKSKYKVHVGDEVIAKVNLYGYQYNVGKKYLFCLNKYFYMSVMYKMDHVSGFRKSSDIYCPTSFTLDFIPGEMSEDYDNHLIDKATIVNFLNK